MLIPVLPRDAIAGAGEAEPAPRGVAIPSAQRRYVAGDRTRHRVLTQDDPEVVDDHRRAVGEPVKQMQQPRTQMRAREGP